MTCLFALFGRLLFVCELCNCVSTCRSTRLYKKRWIYWEADGHLTLFCGIPLLLDISMSKSSMFITIKSWSARALLWCPKKHEFQLFCFFIKGEKKQLPNRCRLQMFYYSNQDFICDSPLTKLVSLFWRARVAIQIRKNDFFSVDDTLSLQFSYISWSILP